MKMTFRWYGPTDRIHVIFEYSDLDQPAPDWVS